MDKNTLQGMLKALGSSYRETYLDEVAKMTEIVNEQKTIKTKEMGIQWTKIFKDKWQVDQKFTEVHPSIINQIIKQCAGNPLLALAYFVNLVQNGYTKTDINGFVNPTLKFTDCEKMKDFVSVPVPRSAVKFNLSMIDKYI